jgi:hypothetical protein
MKDVFVKHVGTVGDIEIEDDGQHNEFSIQLSPGESETVSLDDDAIKRLKYKIDLINSIKGKIVVRYDEYGSELDVVSTNTSETSIYANGTTGSDNNDGLSLTTPKKTIQAVLNLCSKLPEYKIYINIAGVFDEQELMALNVADVGNALVDTDAVVIDGGDDLTAVDDNSESNYVADTSSTSTIGDTVNASWTADEYVGLWVEILTGDAAGDIRPIESMTTNTITIPSNILFSADPGAGAEFRIVRPATEIKASVSDSCLCLNLGSPSANVRMQRVYFSGSKSFIEKNGEGQLSMAACVIESTYATPLTLRNGSNVSVSDVVDPSDGSTLTNLKAGLSVIGSGSEQIDILSSDNVSLVNLLTSGVVLNIIRSDVAGISYSRLFESNIVAELINTSGYLLDNAKVVDSSGVGVKIVNSNVKNGANGCDISGCGSHAIEAVNSFLDFSGDGVVAGTGSTGAGLYTHSGSVTHIKNGTPPTITGGTPGDVSSDGSSEGSEWATIDSGTAYVDANELTMVKEV